MFFCKLDVLNDNLQNYTFREKRNGTTLLSVKNESQNSMLQGKIYCLQYFRETHHSMVKLKFVRFLEKNVKTIDETTGALSNQNNPTID